MESDTFSFLTKLNPSILSQKKLEFKSKLSSELPVLSIQLSQIQEILIQISPKPLFSFLKQINTHIKSLKIPIETLLLSLIFSVFSNFPWLLDLDSISISKPLKIIFNLLELIPIEMLILHPQNKLIQRFLSIKNKLSLLNDFFKTKLKEDILIDRSQRKKNINFKYFSWMNQIITQELFENFLIPNILNLLRRSENNIETLKEFLEAGISNDFSNFSEEILKILKESLSGKNSDSAIFVIKEIVKRIEKIDFLTVFAKKFDEIVITTLNEGLKINLFVVLIEIAKKSKILTQDKNILNNVLNSFVNNFNIFNLEESLFNLRKYIENLAEIYEKIDILLILNPLKKALNQNNKLSSHLTIIFLLNFFNKIDSEQKKLKDFIILLENIENFWVINVFKTPNKLITNHGIFLNALECCFLIEKDNKNKIFQNFFNENLYIHQNKFLSKINSFDSVSFIQIILIFSEFQEKNKIFDENQAKIAGNSIMRILFDKNSNANKLKKLIKSQQNQVFTRYLIIGTFLFTISEDYDEKNESFNERLDLIRAFLIKNLDFDNFNEIFEVFWIFSIAKKDQRTKFLVKITDKSRKDKFLESLDHYSHHLLLFFCQNQDFSQKKALFFEGFVRFFIDFSISKSFLDPISRLMDSDKQILESFSEEILQNSPQNNEISLRFSENARFFSILGILGLESFIIHSSKEEKPKKKSGKPSKKPENIQKAEKIELIEDKELERLQKEALERDTLESILPLKGLLKSIGNESWCSITELTFFSEKIWEKLEFWASKKNEFRGILQEISISFFDNSDWKLIKSGVTEVFIEKSMGKAVNKQETVLKMMFELIEKSKNPLWQQNFWLNLTIFVMSNKDFEMKVKGNILKVWLEFCKSDYYSSKHSVILSETLRNINVAANFEEDLTKLLVFLLSPSNISLLFEDLLELSGKAKEICLKSFLSSEKINTSLSFELLMKLKVLEEEEIPEISNLSRLLLNRFNREIIPIDISSFKMHDFLLSNSKDNNEQFCIKLSLLLKEIPSLIQYIFDSVLNSIDPMLAQETADDERFLFFPHFFDVNLEYIPPQIFKSIYSMIIKLAYENNKQLLDEVISVGRKIIVRFGAENHEILLALFDQFLDRKDLDTGKQVVILVFVGELAKFLSNKQRIQATVNKILELIMKAPIAFQLSLAKGLAETVVFFENPEILVHEKLKICLIETDKQKQRGNAYLVAGMIRGLGVNMLEKLEIIKFIKENSENLNKKDQVGKQGVLLLILALLDCLGKLMEPYIMDILSVCMAYFGENNETIRDLSMEDTRLAMSKLSCYGVKQILPLLLKGLEEKSNWRAKLANISALGNMAYCSPKQLSACLPQIIPCLSIALSDTHPKIKEGASDALQVIGRTIKNPEISENVDLLIKAINNPFDDNKKGLDVLLKTQFVHYIDIPSLSFIIPIVEYGLKSRESLLKENASQVVGTISHLIKDPKCLLPYSDILINALKIAVCDPIGDVRTIAAKAFGALARKLGEQNSFQIIDVLKGILEYPDSKNTEKAGAAQAYSEVIVSIGEDYLDKTKDYILKRTLDKEIYMRESYIGLFVYLPGILEDRFEKYLALVLDHLVEALADENENIRMLSLRVVKILIDKFGMKNTPLLLAPINEGLFSSNVRKRNSAISLTGDLIRVLAKRGGNNENTIQIQEELLASVYILRHDEYDTIRNAADNVWKECVTNKPKTLKQILRVLVNKLIRLIVLDSGIEKVAVNTIKEYCQKYSDSIFQDLLEIIANFINNKTDQLHGTFVLLQTILIETQTGTLYKHFKEIELLLTNNMLVSDELLRKSVFKAFDSFLDKFSDNRILIDIVQPFFDALAESKIADNDYECLLKVFDELLGLQNQRIIAFLIKNLFTNPLPDYKIEIITNNAMILAEEIYEHIESSDVFHMLFEQTFECNDPTRKSSLLYCLCQLSINLPEQNVGKFIGESINLIRKHQEKNKDKLKIVLEVLRFFYQSSLTDFSRYVSDYIYMFIPFLFNNSNEMSELVNSLLKNLLKTGQKELCCSYLSAFSSSLTTFLHNNPQNSCFAMNTEIGLDPYINILINTLVYGSQDDCLMALDFYQVVFKLVKPEFIAPHILKLVGPLIRVANCNYPNDLKAKIAENLLKIHNLGLMIKAFEPQLQLTYLRLAKECWENKEYFKICVNLCCNITHNSIRRDFFLNEIVLKAKDPFSEKILYLNLLYNILKKNVDLFAKALLENSFSQLLNIINNFNDCNEIYLISKILGIISGVLRRKLLKDLIGKFEDEYNFKIGLIWISICRNEKNLEFIKEENNVNIKLIGKIEEFINNTDKNEIICFVKLISKCNNIELKRKSIIDKIRKHKEKDDQEVISVLNKYNLD